MPFHRPWFAKNPGQIKRTFLSMAGRVRICEYVSRNGRSTSPSTFRRQVSRSVSWSVIPMVSKSVKGVISSLWVSRSAGFLSTRSFRGKSFGSIIFLTLARTSRIHENSGLAKRPIPVMNLTDILRNLLLDILFLQFPSFGIVWQQKFFQCFEILRTHQSLIVK